MLTEKNKEHLDKLNNLTMKCLLIERIDIQNIIISLVMSTIFSFLYGYLAFVVGFILVLHKYVVFKIEDSKTLKVYNSLFMNSGFEKDTIHEIKDGVRIITPIWKLKDTPLTDVYIKRIIS